MPWTPRAAPPKAWPSPPRLRPPPGKPSPPRLAEFRDRPFRQGRARIFGEKGLGRDDPGMVAFRRIVESLA